MKCQNVLKMKYLRYINDTTTSNSEASDLLLNSFHTKIDSSTSALSAKADQSLENITSLTQLTSTIKTYVQQIEITVDKSAKEISSLNAKVDSSAEATDALSNRTTAIEDATGQLANVVHALLGKVENITAQQVQLISCFTELKESINEIKQVLKTPTLEEGTYTSCLDVLQQHPNAATSGYYTIISNGDEASVYCDMEGTNCGREGGWMRIADVDMTQDNSTCPTGLYTYNLNGISHDLCDYQHNAGGRCDSTTFPTYNVTYSSVCGRVRGYQHGAPDGIHDNHWGSSSIDSYYVDGVSITHGSPRQHVWTFIVGQGQTTALWEDCPCNTGSAQTVLSFVGDDYYCESGATEQKFNKLYPDDPLWDGQQCNSLEGPCCTNANLPYFKKTLDAPSIDDIELRICGSEGYPDEANPVDIIELYVR